MFAKTKPVVVVPYDPSWPSQFTELGSELREHFSKLAIRIDHIGSTSVPGLAAKDIIDVQITVKSIDDAKLINLLEDGPYRYKSGIHTDLFLDMEENSPELRKRLIGERPNKRRANIHIREEGRLNQEYALLFRDYLRTSDKIRFAYETIKIRLAKIFPNSIEGYLFIKDPLMDMMFLSAKTWAKTVNWQPDETYM